MKIYKYRSDNINDNYLQQILNRNEFYFADWRKLNDPMEGFFSYYISNHSDNEIKNVVAGKDSYGICSFSLTYDEILLWTNYSNNHQGICIEIEIDEVNNSEFTMEEVTYKNKIPWLLNNRKKALTSKDILKTKIRKWQYEKEIRGFCCGKGRILKVGNITKVILGIRSNDCFKDKIRSLFDNDKIKEAKIDFDKNIVIIK